MDVTLHLPVEMFAFKYCSKLFYKPTRCHGPAWRLNLNYKEAKFLHALLERIPNRYERFVPKAEELYVLIPSKIAYSKGSYLSQDSIDMFNDYIKQVIMDEIVLFHTGIQTKVGLKAIDKVAINQYQSDRVRVLKIRATEAPKFYWQKAIISDILKKYDITEDDLSTDAIVKYLQRHTPNQLSA